MADADLFYILWVSAAMAALGLFVIYHRMDANYRRWAFSFSFHMVCGLFAYAMCWTLIGFPLLWLTIL